MPAGADGGGVVVSNGAAGVCAAWVCAAASSRSSSSAFRRMTYSAASSAPRRPTSAMATALSMTRGSHTRVRAGIRRAHRARRTSGPSAAGPEAGRRPPVAAANGAARPANTAGGNA